MDVLRQLAYTNGMRLERVVSQVLSFGVTSPSQRGVHVYFLTFRSRWKTSSNASSLEKSDTLELKCT